MQMMKPMLDMIMDSIMTMTLGWFETYKSNGMHPKQKIKVKVILNWTISLQAWVKLCIWHVPLKKYILVRHRKKMCKSITMIDVHISFFQLWSNYTIAEDSYAGSVGMTTLERNMTFD